MRFILKKITVLFLIAFCVGLGHASKLSKFLNKVDEDQKRQAALELQQDMNFNDLAFRLTQRYVNDHGQHCRDYEFRGRSNPYKHGFYTICDDR